MNLYFEYDYITCRWDQEFFLLHVVQTGPGVHPPHTQRVPGVKWQGPVADHSTPSSTEVNKMWIYTSTPTYAFMA
jgi:hypothetical protein